MPKKLQSAVRARRGENVNEIYNELFRRLIQGDLKAGDRIRELDITEQFGSSRTPVREALKRLEIDGLLKRDSSGGLSVITLDHTMIAELYVMREVLESTAAQLAAKHATPQEILSLKKIVADHRATIADPRLGSLTNRLFHNSIYKIARNQYLVRSMAVLSGPVALLPTTTLTDDVRVVNVVEEHEAIVEAIAAGDVEEAGNAAARHIQSSYRARLGSLFDELYDSELIVNPLGWTP